MRIVQRGSSSLAILYLVGQHLDAVLRKALPGVSIVAFDDAVGLSPREVAAALKMDRVSSLVLIGYSQGVQAVRSALRTGQLPVCDRLGVVCIDGTHASIPPEKWQLDIWRNLEEEARRGEKLFVATATNNVYTAKLPQPFMPTLHVLRATVEPTLFPADPPQEVHTGDLHVYAYASEECDKQAHAEQQTRVLPEMLRRHVAPWIERGASDKPELKRTPLDVALGYVGWKEDGPNEGAIVRASLARCTRRIAGQERPLGIRDGVAWRAGFVGLCDFEAHERHPWRASVRELVEDAREAGTWRPYGALDPSPGDLVIYKRGGKDPRVGGEGHVDRVVSCVDGVLDVVGGNVNNAVTRRTIKIGSEPNGEEIVGWIVRSDVVA